MAVWVLGFESTLKNVKLLTNKDILNGENIRPSEFENTRQILWDEKPVTSLERLRGYVLRTIGFATGNCGQNTRYRFCHWVSPNYHVSECFRSYRMNQAHKEKLICLELCIYPEYNVLPYSGSWKWKGERKRKETCNGAVSILIFFMIRCHATWCSAITCHNTSTVWKLP